MRTEKDFKDYLETVRRLAAEEGYDSLDETYVTHLQERFFGNEVMIGQGPRVTLREIKKEDLELFYGFSDVAEEPVLNAFIKETKAESEKYLEAYIAHMYPMLDYGIWTVELTDTKEIVGLCGLGNAMTDGMECIDLGYYICPKYRNQGLATECIEIALDYAKNYLEIPSIYAIVNEENKISERILLKFGFQCREQQEKAGRRTAVYEKELNRPQDTLFCIEKQKDLR